SEDQIENVLKEKDNFKKRQLEVDCEFQSDNISIEDVLDFKNIQFIDVREIHEQPKVAGIEIINIPLNQLESNLNIIDSSKEIMIFCQSGIRSKRAVSLLRKLGILQCFSIKEGALEINAYLNEKQLTHDR